MEEKRHPYRSARDLIDGALETLVVPSFSRVGYMVRSRLYGWREPGPGSLFGRVIAITGATSGLGLVTAKRLARAGASLRVIGRSQDKLLRLAADIRRESGIEALTYVADLSDLGAVGRVAAEMREREPRLDVLINNAGSLLTERTRSVDGYEATFATMVLGPFVLTNELLPMLETSDDGRVIIVTSGGMYTQGLDLEDLQLERRPYKGALAYAHAKRMQVVLTRLWAERTRGTSVVVHAMHPGWAETPGVEASLPKFRWIMGPVLRTPEEGADTIVWLASAEEPRRSTGRLWLDRRPRPFDRLARTRVSREDAGQLWSRLEAMAGDGGKAP